MLRPLVRFAGSVLLVSGILLVCDAIVTVTWQEPVSAFVAGRQQSSLEDDLAAGAEQAAADRRELAGERDVRRRLRALAGRARERARAGEAIGRIRLPSVGAGYVMVEGTDGAALRKGPGHYASTAFPGEPGTVGVAGHRTTYMAPFRRLDRLRRGDEVVAEMPYGRFTYRVERTRIVEPSEREVLRRTDEDQIVLTACHPLYSAAQRIVVFARFVRRGPAQLERG